MIKSFLKFLKSKDFKEFLTIFISGLIIIALCLFVYKCPVKASSAYFPMGQNQNGHITQRDIDYLGQYIDLENNYYMAYYYGITGNGNTAKHLFYIVTFPKSSTGMVYGEIQSNGYKFNLYNIGTIDNNCALYDFKIQVGDGYYSERYTRASGSFSNVVGYFNGYTSSVYDTNRDYISNFKIWTSNNTNNRSVILNYGWELPPDFMHDASHATPPDTFESPVYTTGHTPPTNVPPTYTINNYNWTTYTPPTIDTSNAETLLESIYDAIVYNGQYLKDNIHGELTNLVDNIGGFVEYIGDTIQYYGNLIISNIQNGITTFYNNINSAIVGIGNAVGYITQPLDMENLTNAVNSTQIWGDVDTCTTYANDAFGIYGTVAEPNTFKIPLDLRSISLLNITQVYYIDLSWLDGAKSAIRAFMWCIVTFGLLYSIIVDIPNMIRSSK